MAAAAAELGSLPQGSHVGPRTISNASRAMEQLLFRLGGLETIGKVLDSFFARPAVRVAYLCAFKAMPVLQRRTGGVLPIHECGHTDGRGGEDNEAAKWEEKGRARLEQ